MAIGLFSAYVGCLLIWYILENKPDNTTLDNVVKLTTDL